SSRRSSATCCAKRRPTASCSSPSSDSSPCSTSRSRGRWRTVPRPDRPRRVRRGPEHGTLSIPPAGPPTAMPELATSTSGQPGASADLLRLIAENLDVVFYVTAPRDDRVLYLSPAFETLHGAPPGSLAGQRQRLLEFVHELDRPAVQEALRREAAGERTEIEYRVRRPDGSVRWIRNRAVTLTGGGRALTVGVAED